MSELLQRIEGLNEIEYLRSCLANGAGQSDEDARIVYERKCQQYRWDFEFLREINVGMDGSGYPRGLLRDEKSAQARIMAVADIFEALTASDRPYKKGKKLSECLKIMVRMKKISISIRIYLKFSSVKGFTWIMRKSFWILNE